MHKRDPTCAACAFLLLLFLTPVLPQCRQGTPDECNLADIVPGGFLAGKGFDITNLTVREKYWADVGKAPAAGCTLCENPLLEGKPLQRLPLYITNWKANPSCQLKVQHSVMDSVISVAEALTELRVKNDWRNELDIKVNHTPNTLWVPAGSRSEWTESCMKKQLDRKRNKYIFLLHHVTCSYYKVRVSKNWLLSKEFGNDINNLPEKYDSSSNSEYVKLIRNYGTHIGTEVDLGAQKRYLTAVPVCLAVLEDISVSEVSRCLAIFIGVALGLDGVTDSPDFQMCEEKKKNQNFNHLLVRMSEETWGGERYKAISLSELLDYARSDPAVLFYSLEPIHTLVAKGNPRREGLRQAVSEYVRDRALLRKCSQSCPPGSQTNASDFCSCVCPNNNFTNSMCCAPKRGLAKLTLTIYRAKGLWGDYFTGTDGYVVVSFQGSKILQTYTVWNNNNPTWNATFDSVVLFEDNYPKIQVDVWDEDFGWNDNLLGSCRLDAYTWSSYLHKTCFLTHGQLFLKYRVVCGRNLYNYNCMEPIL